MSLFNLSNFQDETIRLQLNTIVMEKINEYPLKPYSQLKGKRTIEKYNTFLKSYIDNLDENWKNKITEDFNSIVSDIFQNNFKPEKHFVPVINSTPDILI